jgi:hypothetical protein
LRLGPIRIFFGRVNGGQEALNRLVENINDAQRNRANPQAQLNQAPAPTGQAGQTGQAQPAGTSHHHHHHTRPLPPQMQQVRSAVRSATVHTQLNAIEAMLQQEIQQLNVAHYRVGLVRQLQSELDRARQVHQQLQTIDLSTNPALRAQAGNAPNQRERVMLSMDNGDSTAPITLPAGWRLLPLHPLGAPPNPTTSGPSTEIPSSDSTGPTPTSNGTIPPPSNRSSAENPFATLPSRTVSNNSSTAIPPTVQSNPISLPIAQPTPTSSSTPQLSFGLPSRSSSHTDPAGDDSGDWLTESEGSPDQRKSTLQQRKTTVEQIGGPRLTSASDASTSGPSSSTLFAQSSPSRAQDLTPEPTWGFSAAGAETTGQSGTQNGGRQQPTVEDADDENK